MAVATQHPMPDPATSPEGAPSPRLFTIDELEAMVRLGIIGQDERVELIEGQIIRLNPQETRHIWAVNRTTRMFNRRDDVVVSGQNTLQLIEWSGPEADVVVLRASASEDERPSAKDVLLVAEVADTSLLYDRLTKAPIYARAGIPEYWIVDLKGDQIDVYREPSAAGYRTMWIYSRGETIAPVFAVQTDAILGKPKPPGASAESPASEN